MAHRLELAFKRKNEGVDAHRTLTFDFFKSFISTTLTLNSGSATALLAISGVTLKDGDHRPVSAHDLGAILIGLSVGVVCSVVALGLAYHGSALYNTSQDLLQLSDEEPFVVATDASKSVLARGRNYFRFSLTLAISSGLAFAFTMISIAVKLWFSS